MTLTEFNNLSPFRRASDIYLYGKYIGKKTEEPYFYLLHKLYDFYIIGKFPIDGDQTRMLGFTAVADVPDIERYEGD